LMFDDGFFFNVDSGTITNYAPSGDLSDNPAIVTFDRKPTIFGACRQERQEDCLIEENSREIIQYDEKTDTWPTIGFMKETRKQHAVVEVPVDFCRNLGLVPPIM